ncbi:MAG: U32 family peptidase [Clostridia bacterium]|nr:U32 family peptidase [Clostridia bacterium]
MKRELLAPAGGEKSARGALLAGANAVYLGLKEFSAREGAENFDVPALERTARFAHLLGARVYVCLNTLVKDDETARFFECARLAYIAGADGILLQDIFLGKALHAAYPQMELHLSTQAGCCNVHGALLAREYGFTRVVLARETPLAEIKKISEIIETEVFVQGALCTCFSGQCYLSSFAGNNSGNRGRCKQPCRKRYRIDRAGFEEYAYALSTSDLCVGERIGELLAAGVTSFKIEGRLRREEYVSAAVRYYRNLLDGKKADRTDLTRAFNRGDYTAGLAFGQEKDFLSRAVQGHIGERVGTVTISGGGYFCASAYVARKGDGFKILRASKEVGGASFLRAGKGGFFLASSLKLKSGDEVRLTTEANAGERIQPVCFKEISVQVRIVGGELPVARCDDFTFAGEEPVQFARSAPLTQEEIAACFGKAEEPLLPHVSVQTENAFLPKSALNAFRRAFYAAFIAHVLPAREELPVAEFSAERIPAGGKKKAVITRNPDGADADIVIYKPRDLKTIQLPKRGKEKYLWLPPLFAERDEQLIADVIGQFDGIYAEGSYGVKLAQKYGVSLFAGAGFNLTNRFAVAGVRAAGAKYYVLSKELSRTEQHALNDDGAFALQGGGISVMELCYCPFGKTCNACDKRDEYLLTDEEGRKFPLVRYRASEGCRFEVYNCVPLSCESDCSPLYDFTVLGQSGNATTGHANRSML